MVQTQLLSSQKDSIFELLTQYDFNPADFSWAKGTRVPRLEYKSNGYFIEYYVSDNPFERKVRNAPGTGQFVQESTFKLDRWDDYILVTTSWLALLKVEFLSKNYWDKIEYEKNQIKDKFNGSTDFFTKTEKEIITEKIGLVKVELLKLGFGESEYSVLTDKLDHLLELSENLNKTDWFSILIGSIISTCLTLAFTPDNVKAIWSIIKMQFSIWISLP